jgi:CubicO group peptidase (beta-lactamase class C family)
VRKFPIIVVAAAIAVFGGAAFAEPQQSEGASGLGAVDKAYGAEAAAHPIGSMTVGVVDHGKLIWTKSYGLADMERRVPATRLTVYRIGSITKQFTGVALLQQVAAGKVGLEDQAAKYLPELQTIQGFADVGSTVTLLSLATHRAGLAREPGDLRFLQGPIDGWEATLREALAHTRLASKPNDEAVYSNIGYAALGLALETAAGTPYTELVESKIVRPLGMTSTSFRPDAAMLSRLAKGYGVANGVANARPSETELATGRGYKIPNGGLFTTVDDLARFMAFEMGYGPPRVLPHEVLSANFQRSYPMQGGGRYGVGYMITSYGTQTLIGHSGAVAGYTASAVFDPKSQIGIVCLRSADYGCEGQYLLEALAALAPSWGDAASHARLAQEALAKRVADQKPYPDGDAVLRRLIGELQRGQPDYSRMGDVIAAATRRQLPAMQQRLIQLGALQSLTFRGVGPGGADIYEAAFYGWKLEWRMALAADGSIQDLVIRPLP